MRPQQRACVRFFAALAASGVLALLAPPHARAAGPLRAGQSAPAFSIKKLNGTALTLESLHGKPIYLNFFASWCGPCREEAPTIVELHGKYHARGLETVGVDEQENAEKAADFAKEFHLPYHVGVDSGPMAKNYGVYALPVHVFIDRKGNVKLFREGEMLKGEIEAAIKSIL